MNFERLTRGHAVAAVSALVLLLVMAVDWYGSIEADAAREIRSGARVTGAQSGEIGRAVARDADAIIARDEKNAWQPTATVDRVLLALLLLSVFVPLAAAAHRAAGRRAEPPWTPSAIAALVASAAALLVAYRILDEPGDDTTATLKLGILLGLLALMGVALGAVTAFQREAEYADMRRAARESHEEPARGAARPTDAGGAPQTS